MGKTSGNEHPMVFISYSHDSSEHAEKVLAFADKLRTEGIDAVLDQYEESPPEGWPRWMDRNIRDADFVLMVSTETYYKRVMGDEKPGKGLGVRWEGNLIYQHLYDWEVMNSRFVPVLFETGDEKYIPVPAKGASYYLVNSEEGYEGLYRRLTSQSKTRRPGLGELKELLPRDPKTSFFRVVSEDGAEGRVTEGAGTPAKEWISAGKTEDVDVFSDLKKRWEQLKISKDVRKRGFEFERWLKDLLVAHGFYVHGSFRRNNPNEQIDGAIHFGFQTLLLEVKWLQQPVDGKEIDRFTGRLQRAVVGTHGLFFSTEGFNGNAIKAADSWRSSRLILLADATHLESLVNQEFSGRDWVQVFCHLAARKGTVQISVEEIFAELQRRAVGSVQKQKSEEVWFSDQLPKKDTDELGRAETLGLPGKELSSEGFHGFRFLILSQWLLVVVCCAAVVLGGSFWIVIKNQVQEEIPNGDPSLPVTHIKVSSPTELLEAIAPYTVIELEGFTYNLSRAENINTKYVKWNKVHDGYEPVIHGVYNLSICGQADTNIYISPRYAWALKFEYCRKIVIGRFKLGHYGRFQNRSVKPVLIYALHSHISSKISA